MLGFLSGTQCSGEVYWGKELSFPCRDKRTVPLFTLPPRNETASKSMALVRKALIV